MTRLRIALPAAVAALTCAAGASCSRPPADSEKGVRPHFQADGPAAPVRAGDPEKGVRPLFPVAHGDHNPHHGGIVMMKGDDLHYEVVVDPTGRAHHVYFTDAVREDLPASVASDVVLTIHRPGQADERVALQIDDAGESWVGGGRAVSEPSATSVRVAFAIRHEPYWIDLPLTTRK